MSAQNQFIDMLNKLMEEAINEGVITCPKCKNEIEPDGEKCHCGWINPLKKYGYI